MRNPIRLKNFRGRYLVWYLLGAVVLVVCRPSLVAYGAGASLVLAGGALRSWGAGHLVKNDELTISGPYARLRHPLYAGTLLVGLGFAVIAGGWLTAAVFPAVALWFFLSYFPRKERTESARLELLHGEEFAAYRAAVPALVPGRAPWRPAAHGAAHGAAHVTGLRDSEPAWSLARYSENNELGTLVALLAGLAAFAVRALIAA